MRLELGLGLVRGGGLENRLDAVSDLTQKEHVQQALHTEYKNRQLASFENIAIHFSTNLGIHSFIYNNNNNNNSSSP